MFAIVALYAIGFVSYRSKISTSIGGDAQLAKEFSLFLSKSWLWIPFNWSLILIYFSYRKSNSIVLMRMARNLIILSVIWIVIEIILFVMIAFFYAR